MTYGNPTNLGTAFTLRITGNDKVGTILLTTGPDTIASGAGFILLPTPDVAQTESPNAKVYALNSTAQGVSFNVSIGDAIYNQRFVSIHMDAIAPSTTYQFAYLID